MVEDSVLEMKLRQTVLSRHNIPKSYQKALLDLMHYPCDSSVKTVYSSL